MSKPDSIKRENMHPQFRLGLMAAASFLTAAARGEDDAVRRLVPHLRIAADHGPAEIMLAAAKAVASLEEAR